MRVALATGAWHRVHPGLTHRCAWLDHDGPLPVIEGTLIRLQVDHLPGDRAPKPVWLWSSATGATPGQVGRLWQAFLRRFDLEHTFRLFKQVLGWTITKIRDPLRRTGGPGSSSPATPSSASAGHSLTTCATPGNGLPRPAGLPPPASAGI